MPRRHAPVALGSTESRSVNTNSVLVSDVSFPAGASLPRHTHDRTVFGVMIEGSFESSIAGRTLACGVETAWTEPLGEQHANAVGSAGARVLVIQPDSAQRDTFDELLPMLADVRLVQTAGLNADARRLTRELRYGDPISPLAIDALALLMMVTAARVHTECKTHGGPPTWLLMARDALREQFVRPPRLDALARFVGVSPSHLAHSFRRYFHTTPGEFVRRARAAWASDELTSTDRPLTDIALSAGYCDQAHLTRDLRTILGSTPGALRARAAD